MRFHSGIEAYVHQHRLEGPLFVFDRVQQHLVELGLAIGLGGVDPVVDDPEAVELRVEVDTGDDPDGLDDALGGAAPWAAGRLDLAAVVLVEDRLIEEHAALRGGHDGVFDVVPDERGRDFLPAQLASYGVVAPPLGMVGEVGQRVVDLAGEQKLAVFESGHRRWRQVDALTYALPITPA